MENLTAKLYRPNEKSYTGTAWLCSCQYALTAAHCVGDRARRKLYPGPFRLVFMNGEEVEAEVLEGNYDFDLDAALLHITRGQLPENVQVNCGQLPAYKPWPPRKEVWSAYGYPLGNDSGMEISGFITSPTGNVKGQPAIQLYCDQGGYGKLQGTSGAAIKYEKVVIGLVRWAPKDYKQSVIYASPLHLIAKKLPVMEEILAVNFKAALAELAPNLLPPSTIDVTQGRRGVDKELIGKNTPHGAGAGKHNLPVQQTAFTRRKVFDDVVDLLRRGGKRLLTLTGASGTGKTRLASAAGEALVSQRAFRDGVFFVGLATLKDDQKVAREIANTLGIKEAQNFSFAESLKLYLSDKNMLLIVDNFEQVLPAASLLNELLKGCPDLSILVTSRDPLGLPQEEVIHVGPLRIPDSVEDLSLQSLKDLPPVRLFITRARQTDDKFELTAQNGPLIARICSAVGGLPMAIELIAAQAGRVTDLQSALEKISATAAGASLSDKLQTAVEWAYGQLKPEERTSLRRLSIFVGSFNRQAAEDVCRDAGDSPEVVRKRLDTLSRRCLLQEEQSQNGDSRYRMLQRIQEYCLQELKSSGELAAARRSHARYYLELAKKAEMRMTVLTSEERKEWLDRLEKELDDIRAVLKWSLGTKDGKELGLQLASSLFWFWNLRGYLTEGREHLAAALGQRGEATAEDRARALYAIGGLAFLRGDYKEARGWLEESVKLWREIGNKRKLGYALIILGMVALNQGYPEEGREYEEESVSLFKEVDDKWGLALSLNDLGNVLNESGDRDQGQLYYQQSLALWRELGDKWGYSLSVGNLGQLALWSGDHVTARELQLEALAIRRAEGDQWGFAESLRRLGSVFSAQNDDVEAAKLYYDSLVLHQQLGRKQLIAECLEDLAWVAVKLKHPLRAAELYGAGRAIRGENLVELTPRKQKDYNERVEAAHAEAEASASSDEFNQAWSRGMELTIEQAVSRATQYVKEWTQPRA